MRRSTSFSTSFVSLRQRQRTMLTATKTIAAVLLIAAATVAVASASAVQDQSRNKRRLDEFAPMGMQSGPDFGNSVASAVTVHNGNEIWMAGTTHGNWFQPHTPESGDVSGCFLAQIVSKDNWGTRLTLDIPKIEEDCSNLLWLSSTRVVVSGHAEPGGLLQELFDPAGYTVVDHFGMLLDLDIQQQQDVTATQTTSTVEFLGGNLMQQVTAAYPMALTMDTSYPPSIYVISMESDKVTSFDTQNRSIPLDWYVMNDPMRFFPAGLSFNMVVTKMKAVNPSDLGEDSSSGAQAQESLEDSWRIPYAAQYGRTVHAAAIQKIRAGSAEVLLVAGTTTGHGSVFGSLSSTSDNTVDSDLDGFVTRLSTSTGKLESVNPLTRRINSLNSGDDWVGGMCVHESTGEIYVVGSTAGSMLQNAAADSSGSTAPGVAGRIDAFLLKLNSSNLETVWAYQLGAKPRSADDGPATATGVACAVTQDGAYVYMAGVVQKGAVLDMSGTVASYGDDDVYVVQLDAKTGQVNYVRQIGSEAKDEVGLRNSLSVDQDGNAVLVGTTFGSFYRQRDALETPTSDVFVATISKFNGALVNPLARPQFASDAAAEGSPDTAGAPAPSDESQKAGIGVGMLVLLFLAVLLTFYCCFFSRREKSGVVETDRSKVLSYLNKFDVEDVDLKHSATGGWHCSYSGPLSMGINNKSLSSRQRNLSSYDAPSEDEEEEVHSEAHGMENHLMAPLTGTSGILEDTLEEEEEEEPRGLDGGSGRRKQYHDSTLLGDHGWENERNERVSGIVNENGRSSQRRREGRWGRDII